MNFFSQNPENFLGNSISFHESQILKRSGNLSETEITPEEKDVLREILDGNYQSRNEEYEEEDYLSLEIPEESPEVARVVKDGLLTKTPTYQIQLDILPKQKSRDFKFPN